MFEDLENMFVDLHYGGNNKDIDKRVAKIMDQIDKPDDLPSESDSGEEEKDS